MRALAGPAMLLVMVGGFLVYRLTSEEDAPSRDFTALEFAGADDDHTGSCYSLDTVLITNRERRRSAHLDVAARGRLDAEGRERRWQGHGGPVHVFQEFTFEKVARRCG